MSNKSTWMSGGSGNGVYDPVTTGDGVYFAGDQDDGWLRFKGRKYNFGTYKNSGIKGLCDEIRSKTRPRCLLIGFVSTVLLLLLITIIVIASNRDSNTNSPFEKWVNKPIGLNFRPVGFHGSVYLPFSLQTGKGDSYSSYIKQLNDAVEIYSSIHIHNGPNVMCNSTYAPPDKVCQQPVAVFGTSCVMTHRYGYPVGQPCLLLTLSIPKDYKVRGLVPLDGQVYRDAEKVLGSRFSSDSVGLSCQPATAEDKEYVGNMSILGDTIDYNPKEGFPTYFFRARTSEKFVPPAVMVQFRTIQDSIRTPHMVRMICRAWGKVSDAGGKPVSDDLLTTTFVFRIH